MQAPMAAPCGVVEESWPPSIFLDSIASDEWPVCCLIFTEETPAYAALVAKPTRRLWL